MIDVCHVSLVVVLLVGFVWALCNQKETTEEEGGLKE